MFNRWSGLGAAAGWSNNRSGSSDKENRSASDVGGGSPAAAPRTSPTHNDETSVDASLLYQNQCQDQSLDNGSILLDNVYLSPTEIYDLAGSTSILGHESILGPNHSLLAQDVVPEEEEGGGELFPEDLLADLSHGEYPLLNSTATSPRDSPMDWRPSPTPEVPVAADHKAETNVNKEQLPPREPSPPPPTRSTQTSGLDLAVAVEPTLEEQDRVEDDDGDEQGDVVPDSTVERRQFWLQYLNDDAPAPSTAVASPPTSPARSSLENTTTSSDSGGMDYLKSATAGVSTLVFDPHDSSVSVVETSYDQVQVPQQNSRDDSDNRNASIPSLPSEDENQQDSSITRPRSRSSSPFLPIFSASLSASWRPPAAANATTDSFRQDTFDHGDDDEDDSNDPRNVTSEWKVAQAPVRSTSGSSTSSASKKMEPKRNSTKTLLPSMFQRFQRKNGAVEPPPPPPPAVQENVSSVAIPPSSSPSRSNDKKHLPAVLQRLQRKNAVEEDNAPISPASSPSRQADKMHLPAVLQRLQRKNAGSAVEQDPEDNVPDASMSPPSSPSRHADKLHLPAVFHRFQRKATATTTAEPHEEDDDENVPDVPVLLAKSPRNAYDKNDPDERAYAIWRSKGLLPPRDEVNTFTTALSNIEGVMEEPRPAPRALRIAKQEELADESMENESTATPLVLDKENVVTPNASSARSNKPSPVHKFASILQQWRDKSDDRPNAHFLSPSIRATLVPSSVFSVGRPQQHSADEDCAQPTKPPRSSTSTGTVSPEPKKTMLTRHSLSGGVVASSGSTLRERRQSMQIKLEKEMTKQHRVPAETTTTARRNFHLHSRNDFKSVVNVLLRNGPTIRRDAGKNTEFGQPLLGSDSMDTVDFHPLVSKVQKANTVSTESRTSFFDNYKQPEEGEEEERGEQVAADSDRVGIRVKDLQVSKETRELFRHEVESAYLEAGPPMDAGSVPPFLKSVLEPSASVESDDDDFYGYGIPREVAIDTDAVLQGHGLPSPLVSPQFVANPDQPMPAIRRVVDRYLRNDNQSSIPDPPADVSMRHSANTSLLIHRTPSIGEQSGATHSIAVLDPEGVCQCNISVLNGNDDLIEFFLPRMGVGCTCGRRPPGFVNVDEPTALANILRPWQVDFLASFGIERGDQFVKAHHRSAAALASALRYYRRKHIMTPFRTSSCTMALQIWSKTCKAFVRSVRKQLYENDNNKQALSLPNTLYILSSFLDRMPSSSAASPERPERASNPLLPPGSENCGSPRAWFEEKVRGPPGRDPTGAIISVGEC
jgi:hypothetical protein